MDFLSPLRQPGGDEGVDHLPPQRDPGPRLPQEGADHGASEGERAGIAIIIM